MDDLIEKFNSIDKVLDDKTDTLLKKRKERFELTKEYMKLKSNLETLEKVKNYTIAVGKEFQRKKKEYIENTVTLALQSVFGEDYSFKIKFDYDKRDQLEVRFFIEEKGMMLEPRQGTGTVGGSVVDVCSFALQIICLTFEMQINSISPIIIMDEPFRNVDSEYIYGVSAMITDVSSLMHVQIIMTTHNTIFIENADNIIYTSDTA